MQQGSVIQTSRKEGPDVWQYRWSEKDLNGQRVYRKRVIGTLEQYTDAAAVRRAASGLLSDVNLRSRQDRNGSITIDQLCEHFEQREMRSGASLWSIATQKTYRGYIRRWIRPRWVECPALFVPVDVRETGMKGAWNGTRKEAYARTDSEPAWSGRSWSGEREDNGPGK